MAPSNPQEPPSPASAEAGRDPVFKGLVAIATSLALAGMLASLAAVQQGTSGKLEFRWHWAIVPLAALGGAAGIGFWRILWQAGTENSHRARRRLKVTGIGLGLLALVSFAYPIRFVAGDRRTEVLTGLGLAFVVLSAFGWLIFKTIQWVSSNEPADGEVEPPSDTPANLKGPDSR